MHPDRSGATTGQEPARPVHARGSRLALRGLALAAALLAVGAHAADLLRPPLQEAQGRYFRWAMPSGWHANETTNGVDLLAPDGLTLVSSALLQGGYGPMPSPQAFLAMVLRPLYPDARVTGSRALPGQHGIWGAWHSEEFDLAATAHGQPVRLQATVGVSAGYGRYSAAMTLCQGPARQWPQLRAWLPAVAQSILVTNLRQVAGQDRVMLPRNNPLDNSGLIESWRQKGLSESRISQARREGTMGYERMEDPATGRRYDMPYENYDAAAGGYRNPLHPDELLRKVRPGE